MTQTHASTTWVAAAPFRYHVEHLVATTGVPWQIVAMAAHVPLQLVRTLIFGRDGRRRPLVSPNAARRLYAVTPDQLLRLRQQQVPASQVQTLVTALLADGADAEMIASWLGTPATAVERWAEGAGTSSVVAGAMLRLACVRRGVLCEPASKAAA